MLAFYEFKGDDWCDIANAYRSFNDIHPESAECVRLSKTWAGNGTHIWKIVNEKLDVEAEDASLQRAIDKYEVYVEMATVR